jgi:hypothetical protein
MNGDMRAGSPGVGDATIQDVGPDGRRLIIRGDWFKRIWAKLASDPALKDFSWLDVSFFPILSGDGSMLAFGDGSTVGGPNYSVMLKRTDGSPAVKLGEGAPLAMSRDKQWVLSDLPTVPVQLMLLPTGAGEARRLDGGEFTGIVAAAFLSATEILVCGSEPKHLVRCYVRPLSGGKFRPFTPEGLSAALAAPDGQSIIAVRGGVYHQYSTRDGAEQPVPGVKPTDQILRYSPDGKFLWARRFNAQPVHIEQIDLKTGARSVLLPDFGPSRAGVMNVSEVSLSDDPRTYTFMERESASYLFELKKIQ